MKQQRWKFLGRPIVVGVLTAVCALSAACSTSVPTKAVPSAAVSIEVATKDWNGWSKESWEASERRPSDVVTVVVRQGSSFEVPVMGDDATFTVGKFSGDTIELVSDRHFAVKRSDGGMSLRDGSTVFTLTGSEPLKLGTVTMDAGTNVTLAVTQRDL